MTMKFSVYDTERLDLVDRFLVLINEEHVYSMSSNADQPNGVCMYSGTIAEQASNIRLLPTINQIPVGIVRQLVYMASKEYFSD